MSMCAGCEGDECCQIQFDMRDPQYGCLIPERFRELRAQQRVDRQHRMLYQSQRNEAQKKLEDITKIVGLWSGYNYEGHPEMRLEIQQLTKEILTILKSEFTTNSEEE